MYKTQQQFLPGNEQRLDTELTLKLLIILTTNP